MGDKPPDIVSFTVTTIAMWMKKMPPASVITPIIDHLGIKDLQDDGPLLVCINFLEVPLGSVRVLQQGTRLLEGPQGPLGLLRRSCLYRGNSSEPKMFKYFEYFFKIN